MSSIPDVAAIAPTNCKAYLYDESDDTVCEVRVPGCQPALRPPPTSGYFCIENNHETTAVWDAATGHAWHISSDHQPRSLDDHHEHLQHLNGTHVDPEDTEHTPLVDGGDLELPTLHPLKHLAGDCAALFSEVGGDGGTPSSAQECLHTPCTELWPDPASTDNCAWSATRDATQPETHALAVCLTDTGPLGKPAVGRDNLNEPLTAPVFPLTLCPGVPVSSMIVCNYGSRVRSAREFSTVIRLAETVPVGDLLD